MQAFIVVISSTIVDRNVGIADSDHLFGLLCLWIRQLVVLEEVDQVSLVRLERDLTSKLMHSQFLDNLKHIDFLTQLALSIFEKKVIALLLGVAATTADGFEFLEQPKAFILVGESLS